jgi:universal stress protein E
MTKAIRRILVAIGDVRHAPRAELRKAAALARASGASIELFHALAEPDVGIARRGVSTVPALRRYRTIAAVKSCRRLEQLARDKSLRGLSVRCTAAWDYPPHEAIVRRARISRADLVMAVTRPHRLGGRLLLRNTDWELIRQCPVPLLLVKSRRPYRQPVVLAAVDPFHAHARPADLDARLLAAGRSFARSLRGTLHVFHAYMPLVTIAAAPVGTAPLVVLPPEAEEAHGRQIARAIDELAARAGIPRGRRHVHMGDVAGELRAATRDLRAGLVVMGAVSRSAFKRLFIGNAAEHVLDALDCDVLVVKPRGFKSGVLQRAPLSVTQP